MKKSQNIPKKLEIYFKKPKKYWWKKDKTKKTQKNASET